MRSPVVTITEGMKEKNQIKKKIGLWSLVKVKVRQMDENKSERRIKRIRKDLVGFFQSMVGKKNFYFNLNMGRI